MFTPLIMTIPLLLVTCKSYLMTAFFFLKVHETNSNEIVLREKVDIYLFWVLSFFTGHY